jgi:hypothetical protein
MLYRAIEEAGGAINLSGHYPISQEIQMKLEAAYNPVIQSECVLQPLINRLKAEAAPTGKEAEREALLEAVRLWDTMSWLSTDIDEDEARSILALHFGLEDPQATAAARAILKIAGIEDDLDAVTAIPDIRIRGRVTEFDDGMAHYLEFVDLLEAQLNKYFGEARGQEADSR